MNKLFNVICIITIILALIMIGTFIFWIIELWLFSKGVISL